MRREREFLPPLIPHHLIEVSGQASRRVCLIIVVGDLDDHGDGFVLLVTPAGSVSLCALGVTGQVVDDLLARPEEVADDIHAPTRRHFPYRAVAFHLMPDNLISL